jgi:hypothetical protein
MNEEELRDKVWFILGGSNFARESLVELAKEYAREAYLKGAQDMAEKVKKFPKFDFHNGIPVDQPKYDAQDTIHERLKEYIDACLEEMGKEGK